MAPDGKSEVLPVTMKLIDESGKDIGDCTVIFAMYFKPLKPLKILKKGNIN